MLKIIIAITGASGSIYSKLLITRLLEYNLNHNFEISVIFSDNGKKVWDYETNYSQLPDNVKILSNSNFFEAPASGSAQFDTMIITPCSMGTLGRIASGTSDNLIVRAADVMLKERKKLILVIRETPFNLIHIENMKKVTLAGGIILPASPSFYSKPATIEELLQTVIDKILVLCNIKTDIFMWGEQK